MLVLTRAPGEKVIITVPPSTEPTTIEMILLDIRGTQRARLGYDAKREVTIHRKEIQDEIQNNG